VRSFRSWSRAPEEIRNDQQAVDKWIQAVATLAEVLHALGYPEPLETIMPAGSANPINRWRYLFIRARQLSDAGDFAASSSELRTLLTDMRGSTGSGVDDIQTKVFGLLGTNAIHLGHIPEALQHTEEALRRCVAAGDREGVRIYTENLDVILVAKEVEEGTLAGRQLTYCRERIAFAQDLSDARRHQASNDVLHELLDEVVEGDTAGVRYLGKICGLLGLNFFWLGDLPAARRFTELGLAECRQRQDTAGDRIYSANLDVIDNS